MTERMKSIVAAGRVAVITGAARGIGAALARELHARGMKLALLDMDGPALAELASELSGDVLASSLDVRDLSRLSRFRDEVLERFGGVHLLVNNVGMMRHAGPWDAPSQWRETLDANFTSVLAGQHLFVPGMIESGEAGAIVNLGSKEGITTPPGNAAYSVAKAGVKVLTEQLAHELRGSSDGRISAHLLVPGYTWTPMNMAAKPEAAEKPHGAWTAEQLVDYALARLLNGDFYILCPDNEVTPEIDAKRIRWASDDIIENRPALSRWHPDWTARFMAWMKR